MMREGLGIQAKPKHYVYKVKLLGLDGRLKKANSLIKSMQEPVNSIILGAVLLCREYYYNYYMLINVITENS